MQHVQEARDILVGKISSKKIIQSAMKQLCRIVKVQDDLCVNISAEIIIEKGEIVETILEQTRLHRCDLIAVGASKGLISRICGAPNQIGYKKRRRTGSGDSTST